jgi:hypothetical protein
MYSGIVIITVLLGLLYHAAGQFAAASPFYRTSSISVANIKLLGDTVKRRGVVTNYGGSDVVRLQLDSLQSSSLSLSNSNQQGAGFIDSNLDTFYVFTCNGNDVYFNSVDLTNMNQTSSIKITAFTCNDLPNCAAYDPTSKVAVFALANAKVAGTVTIPSGVVTKLTGTLANDNKFSCTFDTKNRVGYFITASSTFYSVNLNASTITPTSSTLQGTLATTAFKSPVVGFDSTNTALFLTVQYSSGPYSFTLLRYQPTISNWTTLNDNSLGQGQGLMVDQAKGIPYVFTPSTTLVYPDSTFQSAVALPISVWSLMGQGFVDNIPSTATTNGFALDRDIAEVVIIAKSAASICSYMIALIMAVVVSLLINY